ncbi:hypothetical protein JTE90_009868 [Oedothorax gibbosus]|uniref:Protein hedgehog n=1 Tax=Oedothorax gibbosus TaxID=931172 RepID=A0AAV6UVX3_9ARAC|nr:hypothetical protein JTE90_009868 [Oedothorax gibbosus]
MFCGVLCCGPGRGGFRRRSTHKLLPLVFKQHVPNVPENSLAASGPSDARIRRGDERFKMLVPNYNTDVVWADRTGTGSDRIMTRRLKERLDMLAISVQNQWPGVRLRVTNAFDEEGHHAEGSLHYSARAVDVTTSDRDTSKYGLLARMAVNSGFDFVYYESRLQIHCSVKKEQPTSRSYMGCFHGDSIVLTTKGRKKMKYLEVGEEIASDFEDGVSLKFSKVITFLHRDAQMKTMFIKIEIENGNVLLLTKSHIIFRYETRAANQKMYENLKFPTFTNILFNNYEATHAGNILIGDFVYIGSSNGNASISKAKEWDASPFYVGINSAIFVASPGLQYKELL